MNHIELFALITVLSVVNGLVLFYIDQKISIIKSHINFVFVEKKEAKMNLIFMIIMSVIMGFAFGIGFLITIVRITHLLDARRNLDKVCECNECNYHYRLNQVNFIKVAEEIIKRKIQPKEHLTNFTICPNCDNFSSRILRHEELDEVEIKGTKITTFKMYKEIYKDKKEACKILEKIQEPKDNVPILTKVSKGLKTIKEERNEEKYLKNKKEIEFKNRVENINKNQ